MPFCSCHFSVTGVQEFTIIRKPLCPPPSKQGRLIDFFSVWLSVLVYMIEPKLLVQIWWNLVAMSGVLVGFRTMFARGQSVTNKTILVYWYMILHKLLVQVYEMMLQWFLVNCSNFRVYDPNSKVTKCVISVGLCIGVHTPCTSRCALQWIHQLEISQDGEG